MSSSRPPKDDATEHKFTMEGLPIRGNVAVAVTDVLDGPTRRIDIHNHRLAVPPEDRSSHLSNKASKRVSMTERDILTRRFSSSVGRGKLQVGPNSSSLIEDDEDELVDHFKAFRDASSSSAVDAGVEHGDMSETAQDVEWGDIRYENIPRLPPSNRYPLDKCSVFVPRASPALLASCIENVLRERSIVSQFDAKHAKVDCVSKGPEVKGSSSALGLRGDSDVEFRIRLYCPGDDTPVDDSNQCVGIIVEVQRRFGFHLGYMMDVYAILDAASGCGEDTASGQS